MAQYNFQGADHLIDLDKHGTLPQQAIAGAEGVARGASLGLSDVLETQTGLATPEEIKARQEANPTTSMLGNLAGGAGLMTLTGGLAAPIEGAIGATSVAGQIGARALGYGAEGALFGAGNAISDTALGDGNINAQKILSDIGMGMAFGGGLGLLSKGIEAAPSIYRNALTQPIEDIPGVPHGPEPEGPAFMGIKPTTVDDISARIKDAGYRGERIEMPEKKVLEDAASRVEMLNPIHPLQASSLDSPAARDLYKTALELDSKEGNALRNYEALQKKELTQTTDRSINELSPEVKPATDAVEGGNQAIKIFTDNYQNEKELLKPAFEALKKSELGEINHLPGVIEKMTDAVPGVSKMFDTAGESLEVKPYKPSWGIDEATYKAVKNVVNDLKEGPKTFEELSNLRKSLDQHVDILSKGDAPREIMALKKSMMDYMQDVVEKAGEGSDVSNVREIFKRYAINEQERGVIEKVFGAGVGSPEFGAVSKIKPENIIDRIFRDTATVKAAKNILEPKQFDQLLANHLAEQKALATDKGVFSSNKFGSFLKRNQDALNEAFRDKPHLLQKLKDVNNIMRILPDSASINPSGTAKTLWGILKAHSIPELISNAKEYGSEKLKEKVLAEQLNAHLAGKADQVTKLNSIKKIIQKTSDQIESKAKDIFSSPGGRATIIKSLLSISDSDYDKKVARLKDLAGNPTAMMEHLSKSTDSLYSVAPNITQSINNTMVAGLQFLSSKIPAAPNHMALSPKFEPSNAQKLKFNNYFEAVNNPIATMDLIRSHQLTDETMEALTAVHPHLLNDMRKNILKQFNPEKAMDLDYATKMTLSKFLGEPLDEHMLPGSISSYQTSLMSLAPGESPHQGISKTQMKNVKISDRTRSRTSQLMADEK